MTVFRKIAYVPLGSNKDYTHAYSVYVSSSVLETCVSSIIAAGVSST